MYNEKEQVVEFEVSKPWHFFVLVVFVGVPWFTGVVELFRHFM